MDFDQATERLKRLNIIYHLQDEWRGEPGKDRGPHELKIFRSVTLPFSAETWFHLCNSEGDFYVGGCCGTTSHIQDRMNHIFRMDAPWLKVRDLEDLAARWLGHDGDDSYYSEVGFTKAFEMAPEEMDVLPNDPWAAMALIWHLVKDNYEPEVPTAFGKHMGELEQAVSLLSRAFQSLSWARLFNDHDDGEKEPTGPMKANRALLLSRVMPALKTFNERFGELDFGGIEGVALYDIEREDIAHNGHGLCVYETQEEAEAMMERWRRTEAEYEERDRRNIDERISVRPVRITREGGIEWLTS